MGRLTNDAELADAEAMQKAGFDKADELNGEANTLAQTIQEREREQWMKQNDYMMSDLEDSMAALTKRREKYLAKITEMTETLAGELTEDQKAAA